MRTNIEIDDDLMAEALKAGKFKTKKAAVAEGLRLLVQTRAQGRIRGLRGKLRWRAHLTKCGATDDRRRFLGLDRLL